jgi:phage terminase large subunit-like protein
VLADFSGKYSPNAWAQKAVMAYHTYDAARIVAETNNGGALVEMNLRTVGEDIRYEPVRAAQGKRTRAEPIAALYEQGKVHHVGIYGPLEEQLTTWDPLMSEKSPDRLDALVWALSELMLEDTETTMEKWARLFEEQPEVLTPEFWAGLRFGR